MREAYQVAAVRAAERALMELVPAGALMGRAAAGLASVCASLLGEYPGHVYGTRIVVLAGSGDNGGDALYAGALLARRGASVTAITPGSGGRNFTFKPGATVKLDELSATRNLGSLDDSAVTTISPMVVPAPALLPALAGGGV